MTDGRDRSQRGVLLGIAFALVGLAFVIYASFEGQGAAPAPESGESGTSAEAAISSSVTEVSAREAGSSVGVQRIAAPDVAEPEGAPGEEGGPEVTFVPPLRLPPSEEQRLVRWLYDLEQRERQHRAQNPRFGERPARLAYLQRVDHKRWRRFRNLALAIDQGRYTLHRGAKAEVAVGQGQEQWQSYRRFLIDGRDRDLTISVILTAEPPCEPEEAERPEPTGSLDPGVSPWSSGR